MIKIIGVRFRNVGKIYYFSPQDFDIYTGDHVIVETARVSSMVPLCWHLVKWKRKRLFSR